MYDRSLRCKCMQFSGDTIVKSGPDREQQITFFHCHIRCICTVHPQITDKKRMRCRNRTTSHDRCHNRDLGTFYKFGKRLIRSCNIYPTTGKEQRFLCFSKHLDCSLKLSDMNTGTRLISADIDCLRIIRASKLCHYIFREIHKNRTRTSAARNIKCLFDDSSQIFSLSYCHTVFCDTSCNTYNINFLECIISDQMSRNLSGKTYQRYTVIICRCNSCHQIGCTRSACYQTYPDFSC